MMISHQLILESSVNNIYIHHSILLKQFRHLQIVLKMGIGIASASRCQLQDWEEEAAAASKWKMRQKPGLGSIKLVSGPYYANILKSYIVGENSKERAVYAILIKNGKDNNSHNP